MSFKQLKQRHLRPISLLVLVSFFYTSVPYSGALISTAWAAGEENIPTVAVVGLADMNTLVERQARTYLIGKLKSSRRMDLVPDNVVVRPVARVEEQEFSETRKLIEKAKDDYLAGKKLYESLQIDEAIATFDDAVKGYRQGISAVRDNRYLLASHLYLGMALIIRGRKTEGRNFIRQMIVLDPTRRERRLPQSEFPPRIVKTHRKITQKVLQEPTGDLLVKTKPAGATIYVNGVQQPPSPTEIRGLPVGEHFVVATRRGYRSWSRRVIIKKGANRIDGDLSEWRPLAPYSAEKKLDLETNELLMQLGEKLGAEILVLGRMTPPDQSRITLTAQMFDTRRREFSKIVKQNTSRGKIRRGANRLGSKLLKNLSEDGFVVIHLTDMRPIFDRDSTGGRRPISGFAARDESHFYQKWWFWAIVGGLAAGGAGTFFLLRNQGGSDVNILEIGNPLN